MLAPTPALAGLMPTQKATARAAAPASGEVAAAGPVDPATAATATVFDLLADVAGADVPGTLPGVEAAALGPAGPLPDRSEPRPGDDATTPDAGIERLGGAAAVVAAIAWPAAPALPQAAAGDAPASGLRLAAASGAVGSPAVAEVSLAASGPASPAGVPAAGGAAGPLPGQAPVPPATRHPDAAVEALPAEAAAPADTTGEPGTTARPAQSTDAPVPSAAVPVAGAAQPAAPQIATVPPPGIAGWQIVPQPAAGTPRAETILPAAGLAPGRPEAGAGHLAVAVGKGGQASRKLELRLDPPELGRVEIHITPSEKGSVHAVVVAERPETHELLRRHGEVLARELGNAGYSDVNLSFSAGSDAGIDRGLFAAKPQPAADVFGLTAEEAPAAAPAAVAPLRRVRADGGLDIRL